MNALRLMPARARVLFALSAALMMAGCRCAAANANGQSADSKSVARVGVSVHLRDGSRIKGIAQRDAIPVIHPILGRLEAPVKNLKRIDVFPDRETAKVEMDNGDVIRGALDLAAFPIESKLGPLSPPLSEILTVEVLEDARKRLAEGLIAYYPLNGDSKDASGRGNDGMTLGGLEFAGGAAHFDGVDDCIDVASVFDDIPREQSTISIWFRIPEDWPRLRRHDGFEAFFCQGCGLFTGLYHNDTTLNARATTAHYPDENGFTGDYRLGPQVVERGQWHHAVWVYRSGEFFRVYLDGALIGEKQETTRLGIATAHKDLYLGAQFWKQRLQSFFSGAMDDVRFYGRALTPEEITELYNLGRL